MYQQSNHLFYIEDLKLYTQNDDEREELSQKVNKCNDDISIEFGFDESDKASFKRGKLLSVSSVELDVDAVVNDVGHEQIYKYLGVD